MENWKQDDPVAIKFEIAAIRIAATLRGQYPLTLLCGAPGLGKTHTIDAAIQAAGVHPLRVRPANFRDLLEAFDLTRGRRPMILEEADNIFLSGPQMNILKKAADDKGSRTETVFDVIKGERFARTIDLKAPLVITSNLDISDARSLGAKVETLGAMISRASPICIFPTRSEMATYAINLAVHEGLLASTHGMRKGKTIKTPVSLSNQNEAVRFFYENFYRLYDVSPRCLININRDMAIYAGNTRVRDMMLSLFVDPTKPMVADTGKCPQVRQSLAVAS